MGRFYGLARVPLASGASKCCARDAWPKKTSRLGMKQPGDALCYVSPARYAFSSLTFAKRITRLF